MAAITKKSHTYGENSLPAIALYSGISKLDGMASTVTGGHLHYVFGYFTILRTGPHSPLVHLRKVLIGITYVGS